MSFLHTLKNALSKTSSVISRGIENIFTNRKLDEDSIQNLEELLLSADIGPSVTDYFINAIKKHKFNTEDTAYEVKSVIEQLILEVVSQNSKPFVLIPNQLNIILVSGINGNGKTTTIGKMAHKFTNVGLKVSIAACDTFRAAATEQIDAWAQVAKVDITIASQGADPASVAYEAVQKALQNKTDILLIDTAGRLHNNKNLMQELGKLYKVVNKIPNIKVQHSLLVLDATTGQNAYQQVDQFMIAALIDGVIITKLDGTAKAGVILGIMQKFNLPVHFLGIGEKIDDLCEFNPSQFAKSILRAS